MDIEGKINKDELFYLLTDENTRIIENSECPVNFINVNYWNKLREYVKVIMYIFYSLPNNFLFLK